MSDVNCPNREKNLERCTCSSTKCQKRPLCCECVANHLSKQQLPGCFFPPDVEKTWDRSFKKFVEIHRDLLD